MSVEYRRLAAAQRAAASPSRRVLLSWLAIVPILLLFSSVVVAGAATKGGGDASYEQAAKQLPPGKPVVVVAVAPKEESFLDRFRRAYTAHEVCSVSESQLRALAAAYPTRRLDVDVNGVRVDVVVVEGGNDHDVKRLLGDAKLKCKLVRESHSFFLPFDAHTS